MRLIPKNQQQQQRKQHALVSPCFGRVLVRKLVLLSTLPTEEDFITRLFDCHRLSQTVSTTTSLTHKGATVTHKVAAVTKSLQSQITNDQQKPTNQRTNSMKIRIWLNAEKVPAPSSRSSSSSSSKKTLFGKGKLNCFAVLSEISDTGSIMGMRKCRIQTTEM